ncbi:hypothetical protein LINPERPRIM_LOCUS34557 [Linum perenne]
MVRGLSRRMGAGSRRSLNSGRLFIRGSMLLRWRRSSRADLSFEY